MKYCCERFHESVKTIECIARADDLPDETDWYIVHGLHIYYCPFCGAFIKGEGFGDYDKKYSPLNHKNDFIQVGNKKQLKKLLSKAKAGDIESQVTVASYFENGLVDEEGNEIVPQKPKRAFHWNLLAARQGDESAQLAVGDAFSLGIGTKRDFTKAKKWTKKAIKQGVASAAHNLGTIYRDLKKPRLAFKWYCRAVEMGDKDALLSVGLCQLFGLGIQQNTKAANKSFTKILKFDFPTEICECTSEDAKYWIGVLHLLGIATNKKSVKRARKFLEEANKDNDHEQANNLLNLIGKTEYIIK